MTSTGTCLAPMNTYTAIVVSEDGLRRPGGDLVLLDLSSRGLLDCSSHAHCVILFTRD